MEIQDQSTPKAPRSMNKDASAFEQLNTVFSNPRPLSFFWEDPTCARLGFRTKINSSKHIQYFTTEEISAVCQPLLALIQKRLAVLATEGNDNLRQTVRTIWKHCSEPSVFLYAHENKEAYCALPTSIKSIDSDSVVGSCLRYTLALDDSVPKIIIDGFTSIAPAAEQRIPYAALEKAFPGSVNRLQTAVALGLPMSDVANYAFNSETQLTNTEQTLPEKFIFADQQGENAFEIE